MSKRSRRDKKIENRNKKRQEQADAARPAFSVGGSISNRRCLLDVLVRNPRDTRPFHPIKAVIDTGATSACVSEELALALGLVPHGKSKVSVVGGETLLDEAPLALAFQDTQGKLFSKVIPVAIGKIPVPMLFGMRALEPGKLIVDCLAGTWLWDVPRTKPITPQVAQPPSQPTDSQNLGKESGEKTSN